MQAASPGPYNGTARPSIKIKPIAPSLLGVDAPGITTEQSNDVQRVIQSLMDRPWPEWFPKVCISYATGTRRKDARGAGPGMLRAAAITHALYNAGIACASGLCVPVGHDWKEFLPKIDSRFSRCEVLIVLLSPAFYRSKPCLIEIQKSTKAKSMVIIPLRCAEPLPSKDDQWLDIDQKDLLVLDQVQDKLGTINALPPRGCFFDSPSYLDDLVDRVRGVIGTCEARAGALHMGPEATVQWANGEANGEASKVAAAAHLAAAHRGAEEAEEAAAVQAEIEAAGCVSASAAPSASPTEEAPAAGRKRWQAAALLVTQSERKGSASSPHSSHSPQPEKKFAAFVSHMKAEASMEARFLQGELETALGQHSKKIFLDSDDLRTLSDLTTHVRESDVV